MVHQLHVIAIRRDVACYVSTKTSPKPQSLNPHPTVPSPPSSPHCHHDAGRISYATKGEHCPKILLSILILFSLNISSMLKVGKWYSGISFESWKTVPAGLRNNSWAFSYSGSKPNKMVIHKSHWIKNFFMYFILVSKKIFYWNAVLWRCWIM